MKISLGIIAIACACAVDQASARVYLPTADMGAAQPGARPAPKPGTFTVLVVGQ